MSCCDSVDYPLAGLRVIDLADESAAFCGRLLADMGAEVVRIEPPGGDPARGRGPFIEGTDHSLSYRYFNAGKQICSLDISTPAGRSRLVELASNCDVIIETFAPGYLAQTGLGYEMLAGHNPGLIMASVTGFGQSGPKAGHKSCDIVASAAGGQMYVCGRADKAPLQPYGGQPHYLASLFAAIGILLALRWRGCSGKGQHIDISVQECVAAALDHVLVRHFSEGIIAKRRGSLHWNGSSDLFPCRDGHALISFSREWETLVELLENDGLGADFRDPAWSDEGFRHGHYDDFDEALRLWTSLRSREEIFGLGQSMRLPWAALYTVAEAYHSPQLSARGYFIEAGHPEAEKSFQGPRPVIDFGADAYNKFVAPLETAGPPQWQERCHAEINPVKKKLPLEGIRVLDFTWMLAGPYATRILADFGAEVIKVQSKRTATGAEDNSSAYFAAWNRGKLGVTLDLTHPEARDVILDLVKKCDVVIENFTPRVMRNLGLDYAVLKQARPDLVMVSLSGFGQTGPWRDCAALGPTLQALSGLTKLTSYDNGVPYGIGFAYADHVSGLYAALGILAALERRHKAGQGAYLDISEYEATCSVLGPALLDYAVNGNSARPAGNRPEGEHLAPYGCYRCRGEDRWLVMAVRNEDEWKQLCLVMGNPGWAGDARFATPESRLQHADELDETISQWTVKHDPAHLADMLQKAGIAASRVYDARDLADDAHLRERGFFQCLDHPVLGKIYTDSTPVQMGACPAQIVSPAPLPGQHNHYVFTGILGMDEARIRELVERGVIS